MILEKQNVLFFTRTMGTGGTENVILQLCEIFQPLVNKIVVCSCGGVNEAKLRDMGIVHYQIPDIEQKRPKVLADVAKMLQSIVKKENITVIHTHHRMAAFYVAVLRLYNKCKFVNTCHNTFFDKKKLTAFAYRKANLVACGEMVNKNLVEVFGLPDSQVKTIHNAVKEFDGEIVEEQAITELHKKGYFVVANVGRLSEQKGMQYYIQSIPMVLAKHPKTHFLVVGDGEELERLKLLIVQLDISESVTFMGYRSDVQNIMSQIDLVVLSSLWEGLPLTPIEAFSVGKTIVATSVDGTVEIVNSGENGLLIHPKSSKEIYEKIMFLISNPQEKLRLEKNAKRSFEESFSRKKFSEQYINFYKEI